ncbi:selenocysteine-specific translation elongation factor [Georgenia sp.]
MHVIATAGHVDHGKSTLVHALTGTAPDRLPQERRRGLTIELGFAWTSLPGVGDVAFVDVPGHERFVPTMLAGIGPVPAVLLVVAADDPWMPQAAEHLAALDALGVAHGVVAVTRADLADPAPAAARARAELAPTTLRGAAVVPVSATTGSGLDRLRGAVVAMLQALPAPDRTGAVRLWVDRRFDVRGAGAVVTGTLSAGRVAAGDQLEHEGHRLRVRGVQSLGQEVPAATAVARVALNLTGDGARAVRRGSALLSPGAWHRTDVVDVRLTPAAQPPTRPLLHVGTTSVSAHHRPLGDGVARLRLERALPLRVGDRAILRDPGSRTLWGVTVLDPAPPALTRRGDAARRAQSLAGTSGRPDLADELRRRPVADLDLLARLGVPVTDPARLAVVAGRWALSRDRADAAALAAERAVRAHDAAEPLSPGLPPAALAGYLDLPEPLLRALLRPPLAVVAGRVSVGGGGALPPALDRALVALAADLADAPFAAPTADRLRDLGLDERALGAAARAGRVLRPGPGIVLLPDAGEVAVRLLANLDQPFTTSEARVCLGTSRRVILPLLEHLDRRGLTRRRPDDRRTVTAAAPG